MEPIDTLYNNNYFRSRLEARWAYFFNQLGVKYEYEPQGFRNTTGDKYLPDFYLPDTYLRDVDSKGVYVEIKPDSYKSSDIRQSSWFSGNLVLFCGLPYRNTWESPYEVGYDGGYQLSPWWDNNMRFWVCSICKTSKIEFWEGNYNNCPKCSGGCDNRRLKTVTLLATMARFEHGYAL